MAVDLITLGESLIDLPSTRSGVSLADAPGFAKVPAGAPANVAVAAARLGLGAAFLSKVGDDSFGEAIVQTFGARGVDTSRVIKDPAARTGLAFVSIREDGERDFLFYFDPARDLALRPDELDGEFLSSARAFHYGSISLIAEPCRAATLTAARLARAGGALISYDPNLRPRLWPDQETMRAQALAGFAEADIAKVSREELFFLAPDAADETTAAGRLLEAYPRLQLLVVTDGANGSAGYVKGSRSVGHVPGFRVQAVDATGAGDAFVAGLLAFLLRRGVELTSEALAYANACGALAATELGAGMQNLSESAVQNLLASAA
ncbi:MAG: hypothetical protein JO250_06005 [Armatimonadetes bacterium]|nr:hypothetical protein [Armatimonadota bacterium]